MQKKTTVKKNGSNSKKKPAFQRQNAVVSKKAALAAMESVAEVKAVDTTVTYKLDNSGLAVEIVGNTFQGIAAYQRVGRSVKVIGLHFKGYIYNNSNTPPVQPQSHRMVVFEAPNDPVTSGASPTWAQLYQGLNGAGAAITSISAPRNLDYTQNYRILALRDFYTSGTSGSSAGLDDNGLRNIDIHIPNLKINQKYTGATNTSGVSGMLGIAFYSTGTTAAADYYSITGVCRVKFIDV